MGECFRFGRELLWTDSLMEEMCNGDFKIGSMLLSSCLNRFFFFWFSDFPKDLWIYLNLMNIGKTAIQLNYSWIKKNIYVYWIYFACVCREFIGFQYIGSKCKKLQYICKKYPISSILPIIPFPLFQSEFLCRMWISFFRLGSSFPTYLVEKLFYISNWCNFFSAQVQT